MKRTIRICFAAAAAAFCLLLLTSYASADRSGEQRTESSGTEDSPMFTDRDLQTGWSASGASEIGLDGYNVVTKGRGVSVEDNAVRITGAGTYHMTGTLTDGQVVVDAGEEDKIQLVLDNVEMTCSTSACILIKNADKVFVTLVDGTTSTLSDTGAAYVQTDQNMNVDGVIFSKSDLVFNGGGLLRIHADYQDGIVCKDDLKFTGGSYEITAAGKGIVGKDSLRIRDGVFTVDAGDDALHTSNVEREGKGFLYIGGGTFTLTAGDDAVQAAKDLIIEGGTIHILKCNESLIGDPVDRRGGTVTEDD